MTDKELYVVLKNILDTISKKDYPEIYSHIYCELDDMREIALEDPFYLACNLHEADADKVLPECVADFIMKAYEDELAEGNSDAALNIGTLYYTGRVGEQNYSKALYYYDVAAKAGNRAAQENLGYCYYYGRDTEVDYEKAFHYYALGAFDGHIRSLYKIGDMYRNGYYVDKNEKEAFYIYKRCLETMTEEASYEVGADVMLRIADCYYEGIGIEPDYRLALYYYQRAEQMFYDRLMNGDFLIKGNYNKAISRQKDVRIKLYADAPKYDWAKGANNG